MAEDRTAANQPEQRIVITPAMLAAGTERLSELQGECGSEYIVEQVFLAMLQASPFAPRK